VNKLKVKVRNYLWVGEDRLCRAKVAWQTYCLKKSEGGLGLVDPVEAMTALMSKWVIIAMEPGESHLENLLRHKLSLYQTYVGGN
jgi:hypothetical protein